MILDGKKLQEKRKKILETKIKALENKPALVIIQIGDNKESELYIKKKIEFGKEIGIVVKSYQLEENVEFNFIEKLVRDFNNDLEIGGIIIQLPIPGKFGKQKILDLIDKEKDVDSLASYSNCLGATPRAVITILDEYDIPVENKKITVIGNSNLVGRPLAKKLKNMGAIVTICDVETRNISIFTKNADIIITAVGKPGLITKEYVSKGQTVIDVGTTYKDGKLKGDVNFEEVSKIVENITPVPGGVGPMTVLSLFENLID